MNNCKQEFLEHIGSDPIFCARIEIRKDYNSLPILQDLMTGFDQIEWEEFLESIDTEYYNISGHIWYEDDSFSYRGKNVWRRTLWEKPIKHLWPPIPESMIRLDRIREKKIMSLLDRE